MIDYGEKVSHDGSPDTLGVWHQAALRLVATKGKRVLDVGCGSGSFLLQVKPDSASVLGIDPNRTNIEVLQAYAIPGIVGYLEHYAAAYERSFDLVTCFEVIEHLYDPRQLFAAAHVVLAPQGTFVVTTPNAFHCVRAFDFVFRQKHHDPLLDPTRSNSPEHIRLWSRSMLIRAFTQQRFGGVHCYGVMQVFGRLFVLRNRFLVSLFSQHLVCLGTK